MVRRIAPWTHGDRSGRAMALVGVSEFSVATKHGPLVRPQMLCRRNGFQERGEAAWS